MDSKRASDFWWLSEEQASQPWLIGVGHHGEDDDRRTTPTFRLEPDQPTLLDWVHSMDERGDESGEFKAYPLSFIKAWRSRWDNCNVYRTMKLFHESGNGEGILGPFLVDIDSSDWELPTAEDLNDTLRVARRAIDLVIQKWNLKPEEEVRVFFSGRKGFNIEAIPSRLGITGNIDQQIVASGDRVATIRQQLGTNGNGPTIDPVYGTTHFPGLKHPYIRLHDSFNCWRLNALTQCRRRTRLTIGEFSDLPMERILRLASASP